MKQTKAFVYLVYTYGIRLPPTTRTSLRKNNTIKNLAGSAA